MWFTYLNQRRNTRHTNFNILVINKCLRQFFSAQGCLPCTYVWTKTKSANFVKRIQVHFEYYSVCINILRLSLQREFKFILSIIQFVWILRLSISIYWLLDIHMSQAAFLNAKLSTWHMYEPKTKSANFVK